jgi:putative FmdB family regulatory protein
MGEHTRAGGYFREEVVAFGAEECQPVLEKFTTPPASRSVEFSLRDSPTSPGGLMPVYDYLCNDCHKEFETVLTLDEHDHQDIKCPRCGSKNVDQEAAAFFAVTSKKS